MNKWQQLKRKRKVARTKRKREARKHIPQLRKFCEANNVVMKGIDDGYQFCYREYIINWLMATNRVLVQYRLPNHDHTVTFDSDGQPGKPRILVALEVLIDIYKTQSIAHGIALSSEHRVNDV